MDKVNYLAKPDFPLSINTLDNMQNMIYLVAVLSAMGGNNYILSGCKEVREGEISDGYIVVDGEILRFKGGAKKSKFTIKTTRKDLIAFGVEYPEAYIFRDAEFSDNGELSWANFEQISTIQGLQKQINNIKGDAAGTVKMWAGQVSKMPNDYMLCNGDELAISEFPELFRTLGVSFGGDGINNFKLPDLRGRFVVGYDSADPEYNAINKDKKGGGKTATLNVDNLT